METGAQIKKGDLWTPLFYFFDETIKLRIHNTLLTNYSYELQL